jgi:aminoglycoside phosphotransferase (APT) family kinase protein
MGCMSDFYLPAFDDWPYVLVHGDLQPFNIIINI